MKSAAAGCIFLLFVENDSLHYNKLTNMCMRFSGILNKNKPQTQPQTSRRLGRRLPADSSLRAICGMSVAESAGSLRQSLRVVCGRVCGSTFSCFLTKRGAGGCIFLLCVENDSLHYNKLTNICMRFYGILNKNKPQTQPQTSRRLGRRLPADSATDYSRKL